MGIKATSSPILPVYVGSADRARAISETLHLQGIDARLIVPPTIRKGKECLRVVLHSFNQKKEIDALIEGFGMPKIVIAGIPYRGGKNARGYAVCKSAQCRLLETHPMWGAVG